MVLSVRSWKPPLRFGVWMCPSGACFLTIGSVGQSPYEACAAISAGIVPPVDRNAAQYSNHSTRVSSLKAEIRLLVEVLALAPHEHLQRRRIAARVLRAVDLLAGLLPDLVAQGGVVVPGPGLLRVLQPEAVEHGHVVPDAVGAHRDRDAELLALELPLAEQVLVERLGVDRVRHVLLQGLQRPGSAVLADPGDVDVDHVRRVAAGHLGGELVPVLRGRGALEDHLHLRVAGGVLVGELAAQAELGRVAVAAEPDRVRGRSAARADVAGGQQGCQDAGREPACRKRRRLKSVLRSVLMRDFLSR